ncbi:MAG: dienelactone hydrolase, partial [Pseudomonadota bacterium]
SGSWYLGHYDTAIALAEAGYVVAAPTHTGDSYADQSRSVFIMERPRHVSRVIDAMLSGWNGHARIDPARIGIFGFSAGAFTALVSIGGVPDLGKIAPFCKDHAGDFVCQMMARHTEVGSVLKPGRNGAHDVRIKAAVVVAPAVGFAFAPDGLKKVTVPVDLWRAEDDSVLPHPWYAETVREALPKAPSYHVIPKAGHFDFLPPCSDALAAVAKRICGSAAGFDRGEFHVKFNAAMVAFFGEALKN